MANNPSSSAAAKSVAKRKRVGAALASPFRKLGSRLRPLRASKKPLGSVPAASAPPSKSPLIRPRPDSSPRRQGKAVVSGGRHG